MGVPDHTRNDTHAEPVGAFTGDEGSPYEKYASRWTRENIGELRLKDGIHEAVSRASIEEHLKAVAAYSNRYFFSKDTILKYSYPKVVFEEGKFGLGLDEKGIKFKLVKLENIKEENVFGKSYSLRDKEEFDPIFYDYFLHLSKQVIVHGAGVIELYRHEAESKEVNLEFEKNSDPFGYNMRKFGRATTVPNLSLSNLLKTSGLGILNFGRTATANIGDNITGAWNTISSGMSGLFRDNE